MIYTLAAALLFVADKSIASAYSVMPFVWSIGTILGPGMFEFSSFVLISQYYHVPWIKTSADVLHSHRRFACKTR